MTALPLSVIGGYLGAGKTTLINHLLAMDHGLKLAVLVNDFGAINIDASLLQSASEDTIELTNGCVCCTMSGDLFFTIGDLLDRVPRPDHILVEASGIADPAKIAAVSLAEKDLCYSGIVTLVDGLNIDRQLADDRIAAQVKGQIKAADLIAISKTSTATAKPTLSAENTVPIVSTTDIGAIAATLFGGLSTAPPKATATSHPDYVQWSDPSPNALSKDDLDARLSCKPPGLLRLKALLPNKAGGFWEVHVVGSETDVRTRDTAPSRGVVAIGLRDGATTQELQRWWAGT